MEALILAGGLGTRLRSVVSDVPKPMAPIKGRPFLEFLFDFWIENGVDRFVLSTGYQHETIYSHFGTHYREVSIDYSVEKRLVGTGGGVLLALEKLSNHDPFLLINGDTFFDVDVPELLAFHRAKASNLTMVLKPMPDASRFGTVKLGDGGQIEGFFSPGEGFSPYLINGGIYVVDPSLIKNERPRWDGETPLILEKELFPRWIKEGYSLFGWKGTGEFIDIGVPEEYIRCGKLFEKSKTNKSLEDL